MRSLDTGLMVNESWMGVRCHGEMNNTKTLSVGLGLVHGEGHGWERITYYENQTQRPPI